MNDEDIEEIMKEADANGDGKIDYQGKLFDFTDLFNLVVNDWLPR